MPVTPQWICDRLSFKVIALLVSLLVVVVALYDSPVGPSDSVMGVYRSAAIVANENCPGIGRDILLAGGNAVDATIATLLCEGVSALQKMGVGGGFIMTIYNKTTGESHSLVSKEVAPGKATEDMFVGKQMASIFGAKAAGVPGELKGFQEVYRRFGGGVPWKTLFEPTIRLCREGVRVSKNMDSAFKEEKENCLKSHTFKKIVLQSTNGRIPLEGEILKLPVLADTLEVIANSPKMADELYNGSLTERFVADVQREGGIISVEDMNNYQVRWKKPYKAALSGGLTVYSSALPGSGILVTFILRLLDGLIQSSSSEVEQSQMIVEALKHAFGRRSHLCDDDFPENKTHLDEVIKSLTDEESIRSIRKKLNVSCTSEDISFYGGAILKETHGTNNVIVVDQAGSAVSVTSSVNMYFGCKFVSTSTGINLNSHMDDFSTPGLVNYYGVSPSPDNFIRPGKRPMSSMSPTIVVDSKGDVRLVVGGAGGSKIIPQTAMVAIRNLWQGMNIKEAIDARRYHHQLLPMNVTYEPGVPKKFVKAWKDIGHKTEELKDFPNLCLSVVTGVARLGDNLTACYDFRRAGSTAGI